MATRKPPLARTAGPVRRLTASDLGIGTGPALGADPSSRPDPLIADDDPRYVATLDLLDSFGGVIFSGPPGTGKTWHAREIGQRLVDGDRRRIGFVQFHPSYQYEDFMQGFVPRPDGSGFVLADKLFVKMCKAAASRRGERFVLVIDELSRGEPGRVFGEALTYVEKSWRDTEFTLASGETLSVPPNLVVLATMNPLDHGVDEVDAAFERRFAKIAMEPDREALLERLARNRVPADLRERIARFFDMANGLAKANPYGAIGHTYFFDVADVPSLRFAWNHQLRFLVERAYQLDPDTFAQLDEAFRRLLDPPDGAS